MTPPTRTAFATCPLCEATCGLEIEIQGDTAEKARVLQIRGDEADPFSQGHLCPKALALQDLQEDPDRLRRPLRRRGDDWEEIGWKEALDASAELIRGVQARRGKDAVALYLGNPSVHNLGALLYGSDLLRGLGTTQRYSATSVDQLPHQLVAHWMFGHQLLLPVPDIDRTDWMLILGANPSASNGSLLTAPGIDRRLRAIRTRGGRVELVDPRRTETARHVDRHHFIRPGTDALLLAAMLRVIDDEELARPGKLAGFTDGLDEALAALAPFTPQVVAPHTGISADEIRRLARDFASAERAVIYGRFGLSTQRFGVLCQWLIVLLNLVTGNLDHPGGAMFTTPAVDPLGRLRLVGPGGYGRWHSRVRERPEVNGELPVAGLAEEITTPGDDRVRALVSFAGNPVLSAPTGSALEDALPRLDAFVAIDPYLNETTRHADIILPPLSPLERPHYDLVFYLLSVRNVAKWSPAVLPRPKDALDDGQILSMLHERLAEGFVERMKIRAKRALGPARLVDIALRLGPHGGLGGLTINKLKRAPHGVDLGPLEPRLPERLATRDGRIHAAPPKLLEDLERLVQELRPDAGPRPESDLDLQLVGRRQLRSNNSWMHNAPVLMKGEDRCTLLVHPKDAATRGLADGDRALLRSKVGEITVPIEISDEVMPGVVSLPHGFGHHRPGTRQRVASDQPGVSMNEVTDASVLDELGGTAVLSGVPVGLAAC